jgi:hypothetical protein
MFPLPLKGKGKLPLSIGEGGPRASAVGEALFK